MENVDFKAGNPSSVEVERFRVIRKGSVRVYESCQPKSKTVALLRPGTSTHISVSSVALIFNNVFLYYIYPQCSIVVYDIMYQDKL